MHLQGKAETSLQARLECQVLQSTYGRIRNLKVQELHGQFLVQGKVPSHHTKQLALQGALELLSCDRFADGITVEDFSRVSS